MYKKEREDQILLLLRKFGYVTVKFLTQELHYSKATINRDLNLLEQSGMVRRTWGGVETIVPTTVPVLFRYEKAKPAKKKIGKCAAEFVKNGDTIFIDGSTTAQYMGEYLIAKKDIHVLTNNMALASYLSEYGVDVTVLGGKVSEPPYMLSGVETVETALRYRANKCFFSTSDVSDDGQMSYEGDIYYTMHKVMMLNSEKIFYLVDRDKVNRGGGRIILGDISLADYVITDYYFSDETKEKYPQVNFISIDSYDG